MLIKDKEVTLKEAVDIITQGGAVIYPTETFYALGCNALNEKAVHTIFSIKQRKLSHPLPLIAGSFLQVEKIAEKIDAISESLMKRFWPGPLTIILKASPFVPAIVCAGTGKVAIRISSHSTALELSKACEIPLVSSSANISGFSPVTSAHDISEEVLQNVDGTIFHEQPLAGNKPSTIVEVHKDKILLHREGVISVNQLRAAGFELHS